MSRLDTSSFVVILLGALWANDVLSFPNLDEILKPALIADRNFDSDEEDYSFQAESQEIEALDCSNESECKKVGDSKRPSIPHRLKNFSEAKRLAASLFKSHRMTFYCACKFDKHLKIDLNSCGYCVQGDHRRARRVEWEHIMPVSRVARHLPCWKNSLCCTKKGVCYKGRRCCQKIDPWFRKMEADLHNLVPEIGELNKIRSNYRFGLLPHIAAGQFGSCEFKVDESLRRVEPRMQIRGMIARAYLYMSKTYEVRLSSGQQQLFKAWNRLHPPDDFEKLWDKRIAEVQGNHNPFISNYEVYKDRETIKRD
jgi:deoxyribonuclease I